MLASKRLVYSSNLAVGDLVQFKSNQPHIRKMYPGVYRVKVELKRYVTLEGLIKKGGNGLAVFPKEWLEIVYSL